MPNNERRTVRIRGREIDPSAASDSSLFRSAKAAKEQRELQRAQGGSQAHLGRTDQMLVLPPINTLLWDKRTGTFASPKEVKSETTDVFSYLSPAPFARLFDPLRSLAWSLREVVPENGIQFVQETVLRDRKKEPFLTRTTMTGNHEGLRIMANATTSNPNIEQFLFRMFDGVDNAKLRSFADKKDKNPHQAPAKYQDLFLTLVEIESLSIHANNPAIDQVNQDNALRKAEALFDETQAQVDVPLPMLPKTFFRYIDAHIHGTINDYIAYLSRYLPLRDKK